MTDDERADLLKSVAALIRQAAKHEADARNAMACRSLKRAIMVQTRVIEDMDREISEWRGV